MYNSASENQLSSNYHYRKAIPGYTGSQPHS
jgi:hypothetical protein